jgi:hypothetical protein
MTEPTVTEAPDDRRRRTVLLAGGAAAALVLVLVLVMLLSGGGDDGSTSSTTQPTTRPSGATTTTTTVPGSGSRETFEVFTTKNPFLPLRSAGGGAAPSGSSTPGAATPAPGGTAGGTSDGATGAPPGGGNTGGGGSAEPRRGARVALQDVFVEGGKVKANVRVNDTVHKVAAGEVFATNFKAVSLSQGDRCGRFLLGDDPFRLCKGEELLK